MDSCSRALSVHELVAFRQRKLDQRRLNQRQHADFSLPRSGGPFARQYDTLTVRSMLDGAHERHVAQQVLFNADPKILRPPDVDGLDVIAEKSSEDVDSMCARNAVQIVAGVDEKFVVVASTQTDRRVPTDVQIHRSNVHRATSRAKRLRLWSEQPGVEGADRDPACFRRVRMIRHQTRERVQSATLRMRGPGARAAPFAHAKRAPALDERGRDQAGDQARCGRGRVRAAKTSGPPRCATWQGARRNRAE